MAEESKIKVGYWGIRGLIQQIKLLLAYTNTPFETVHYETGGPPDYDRSAWMNVKFTLGFDFPNLPYLIDGDFKLTESNAIMRYIADKNNLLGDTPQERARVSMLETKICEAKVAFTVKCYNPNCDELFAAYPEARDKNLQAFEDLLSKTKWIAGDKLRYIDVNLFETIDVHVVKYPNLLEDKFPNLKKFHQAFKDLPTIKAYFDSPNFEKLPLNNISAKYGGTL